MEIQEVCRQRGIDEPPCSRRTDRPHWNKWLAENITYPTTGFENGLPRRGNGTPTPSNPTAASTASKQRHTTTQLPQQSACGACTGRPRWLPGRKGGEPVAVTVTLPVSFRNAIRPKEAVFAAGDSQPADFMGGGLIAFRSWVMSNLEYPTAAYDNNI